MSSRILFVDDEALVLQGLQRSLRGMREEWQMEFVTSGADALAAMARHPFDAIVSDMRMPGMNGAELLNEVMKVMAIVTCILAPATVIGGIFGMNFEIIPLAHHHWGFYFTVALMFFIPVVMLIIFKKRGWF